METIYLLAVIGILFIGDGLYKTISHSYKVNNYKKIDVFFSDYVVKNFNSRWYHSKVYFPVVSYEVLGKKYKKNYNRGFSDEISSMNCIGKKVTVFYNENNPSDATFLVDKSYIEIIIGILFLIFPFMIFIELFFK